MATESSTAASNSRSGGGGGTSAESYVGSLITLTSKSEIRYEGVLHNINTEESSIGLRNVRSFGTEGRKKDGPQVPPSDKVYEYILFRGSDIKDLQVKASPPVQTAPSINNDPAIIQSHYPRPPAPPSNFPTPPNGSLTDPAQMGLPVSTFSSALPLYQPAGNLNSWSPSPPNANGGGLAMPMYWQGFYGSPNGLPQMPVSQIRPPSGLSIPPPMQQMQFTGFNSTLPTSNLPEYRSSLVPNSAASSASSLTSASFPVSTPPSNVYPMMQPVLASETPNNQIPNRAPIPSISAPTPNFTLASLAPFSTSVPDGTGAPSVANKPSMVPGPVALPKQTESHPVKYMAGASGPVLAESVTPSLITPGHLLQSGPSTVASSQPLQTTQKDVEVVQLSSEPSSEPSVPVVNEAQPPLLPLPTNTRAHKPNGSAHHMRYNYRGRGGRGYGGVSRPLTKFAEDFDFIAMNEKFNKDEVWGDLGKGNKSQSKEKDGSDSDEDYSHQKYGLESPKIEIKPTYNKDDFFDSFSSATMDNDPNRGRTRFSEQMKLDTETFGEFSRHRGGRGGRGPGRGVGGRFRGSYYHRGYNGYGDNNTDRGGRGPGRGRHTRGRGVQNRDL